MPVKLLWTPQAREDLLDIYTVISFDNPAAAERLYLALESKAALLLTSPRLGVRQPKIRPAVRLLVEGAYILLYETRPNTDEGVIQTVEIVRVLDGRRDLTRLLA